MAPLVSKKAEEFSPEAIDAALSLGYDTSHELLNLVVTLFTVFTGMRVRDCTRLYSDRVVCVPHTATSPRHFKCSLLQTKNDLEGTGPDTGLVSLLPCICMSVLSPKEKLRFAQRLAADPTIRCPEKCPYQVSPFFPFSLFVTIEVCCVSIFILFFFYFDLSLFLFSF